MKGRYLSIIVPILGAMAALILCLMWGVDALEAEILRPAASNAPDGWVVECVDCPPNIGSMDFSPSHFGLGVDSEGYPHIAYLNDHGGWSGELEYIYQDAAGWHWQVVDTGLQGYPNPGISLDLDTNGYPHISYYNATDNGLKYAYQDASGWHTEVVRNGAFIDSSLTLDGDGNPHISYLLWSESTFEYAYKDATDWHIETIPNKGWDWGCKISMTLDEDGYPHISYPDENLEYIYKDVSGWYSDTINTGGSVLEYTSLALDDNGYAHISYYDTANFIRRDLGYAYQDASGWYTQTLDSGGNVGQYSSLNLDNNGYSHIAYYDADNDDLKYAYQDASGWYTQTLDSDGDVGQYSSLDLDNNAYSHIAYYDGDNDDLKYAYQDASGWHTQTVELEVKGYVGLYTSLALDNNEYAHISYYDWSSGALKYAYQDASGWYSLTLDSDGDVGQYTSLALDGDGYPHISYYDDSGDNLKYAYQDASGWHSQTVDSDGSVGSYTSLALASTAPYTPHISYYDATNEHPKYAYLGASGWFSETVGRSFPGGTYTSIALRNGYPCISYYEYFDGALIYIRQLSGGNWLESVVAYYSESWNKAGMFNSLALDESGNPWISYYDAFLNSLRLATGWAPTGWSSMWTVDKVPAWHTSLVMSGTYAHISYFDALHGTLKYTYRDASGWYSQTIDGYGGVGQYTSLALDEEGHPHISYYDADCHGLKHAYFSTRPVAAFTADPTVGIYPLTVAFTDTSTGGEADTWLWSFGDGITSTLQSPTHTYTAKGAYTVTLAVSGPGGSDAVSQTNYITIYAPARAAFTANPTSGPIPLDVDFTNTSSGDYSTSLWDFGDGLTSTLERPTHTYTAVGVYTVTLTVEGLGGSNTLSRPHCITAHPPLYANFTAAPTLGFAPLTVTFTNTSGGDYFTSLWDFGDGVTSTLDSPTHTYTLAGTHTVTLTVSGPGGTDMATRTDYITVYEAVRADFTATPDHGAIPLSVSFTDRSGGPVAVWQWDFGDGVMSALQHPTHIYTKTGIYTVALRVQVAGTSALLPGGTDTLTRAHAITVTESPPRSDFAGVPRSGDAPLTVQFTSTVTGTVTDYRWNFGDGGVADTPYPTHTYFSAGSFDVALAVTGTGGTDTTSKPDYITVNAPAGAPTATFSANVVSGTRPLPVTFTAITSGTIEYWLWNFGDGGTTFTGPVVNHTYITSGIFDVRLTVSNTHGSFMVSKPGYITVNKKDESFIYLPLVLRYVS
ncbi:MAG: PKD domain-containing protein [Anaerolineae bacterium]|nr:PKD domain-containing protein [Anaerolineae bacterium]